MNDLTIERHNAITTELCVVCDLIEDIIVQSNRSHNDPDSNSRSTPDLTITLQGITYYIDVTYRTPTCPSYWSLAPDVYLKKGEAAKRKLYNGRLPANGVMVPFVLDTAGNYSPSAIAFVKRLVAAQDPLCASLSASAIYRRMSLVTAAFNAKMVKEFNTIQLVKVV